MRLKIKLIYVAAVAFVIIAGGMMTLNRMDGEIAVLQAAVQETRLRQIEVKTEQSEMQKELAIKDTDAYIRDKARSLYRYLMPGEILFVVENPEVLYGEGEMPRTEVIQTEEILTEEIQNEAEEETEG